MANRRSGPRTNRRHMARQQREALQSRRIMYISYAIVGVVVLLVAYGLIVSRLIEPRQPVATVNGTEIISADFRSRAIYERLLLVSQWNSLADLMISFGATDPNNATFFVSQMNQIEFQLDPTTIGRAVLNEMIADVLIREEAAERGIVVTEAELDTAIEEFFSYYGGNPAPTATTVPTQAPTSTYTPLQMTVTAPTPSPTLTITETASITDTAVVSPTEIIEDTGVVTTTTEDEIVATPEITITATPFPTATPFTLEGFETAYESYIDSIADLGVSAEYFRQLIESQLYREKVSAEITADVSSFQDQVWARHILVASEEEALDVIARLDAGEDFAALATELSTDTGSAANGGDLGWFGSGQMVSEFQKVAFNLRIGNISDPVFTQFGWHVIQVLGHEERGLTAEEYAELKNTVFEEWLSSRRLQSDVELLDIWPDRVPIEPGVPAGGAQALLQQLQVPLP